MMMLKRRDKPAKTVVSKSQYIQVQGQRLSVILGATLLASMCVNGGLLSLISATLAFNGLIGKIPFNAFAIIFEVVFAVVLGAGTYCFGKAVTAVLDKANKMNTVVPLTKANAPYLPVQDSLVRAAAETPVARETILLRAATKNTTTPPEQLGRSSASPD